MEEKSFILGMAAELEKLRFEILVRGAIQGEEGATMARVQRHPTNKLTKLHLVEVGENVYSWLKVEVMAK